MYTIKKQVDHHQKETGNITICRDGQPLVCPHFDKALRQNVITKKVEEIHQPCGSHCALFHFEFISNKYTIVRGCALNIEINVIIEAPANKMQIVK